ncbi:alpha/beta hydrolase [Frigidibacter sp. RF13]|uniref:alpha/beta hydrolase n=1 Tax=Frigidibacter sp. RF13 TaxID=2997340 RepID=UPI002270F7B0|nr:alpha/beta hydrolase [Frigidibacter sp. RF13]MCY1126875.1 alpha/beta hydrolase [Frigidibacter sp. RF13]
MRFDDAFANSKYLADGKDFPSRWARKADGFRAAMGARAELGIVYGPGERHWFDLFLPEGEPRGLVIFIHGGYWLAFGPRDFSHLAAGPVAAGWAVAMPAYTLAPTAGLPQMTAEIRSALLAAAERIAGPVVVTGHSAGGHLSARMATTAIGLPEAVADRIANVVPISPLSDLRPLMETEMNRDLKIDAAVAKAESPALLQRRPGAAVHVWVGGIERPRFLDQARRLGNAWCCPVTVEPDRHHFNVIEGLEVADSPLMRAIVGS